MKNPGYDIEAYLWVGLFTRAGVPGAGPHPDAPADRQGRGRPAVQAGARKRPGRARLSRLGRNSGSSSTPTTSAWRSRSRASASSSAPSARLSPITHHDFYEHQAHRNLRRQPADGEAAQDGVRGSEERRERAGAPRDRRRRHRLGRRGDGADHDGRDGAEHDRGDTLSRAQARGHAARGHRRDHGARRQLSLRQPVGQVGDRDGAARRAAAARRGSPCTTCWERSAAAASRYCAWSAPARAPPPTSRRRCARGRKATSRSRSRSASPIRARTPRARARSARRSTATVSLLICADANQGCTPEQAITYVQAVADTQPRVLRAAGRVERPRRHGAGGEGEPRQDRLRRGPALPRGPEAPPRNRRRERLQPEDHQAGRHAARSTTRACCARSWA